MTMKKHKLAKQLRKCQRDLGRVDARVLNALSDKQIIDSYNKCSDCGGHFVNENVLEEMIRHATDAEHFISLVNTAAKETHEEEGDDCQWAVLGPMGEEKCPLTVFLSYEEAENELGEDEDRFMVPARIESDSLWLELHDGWVQFPAQAG
jgi:hypothetical protein